MPLNPDTASLKALREEARALDVPGYSKMNRDQLITAIEVAALVDEEIDTYRRAKHSWSNPALGRLGSGPRATFERALRIGGAAGALWLAEHWLDWAGRIGGQAATTNGYRIRRLINHERRIAQNLLRNPLGSMRYLVSHHGPQGLNGLAGRELHGLHSHDPIWLDKAERGDLKVRRQLIAEELASYKP